MLLRFGMSLKKVELQPTSDVDMYLFFEISMTGGVSYISKRYSRAKYKYLKSYGYAMSKFLPTNRFKWIDFDSNKYNSNSSKGCFLEFDVEYSK